MTPSKASAPTSTPMLAGAENKVSSQSGVYHGTLTRRNSTIREYLVDRANGQAWSWLASWLPDDPQSVIVKIPTLTNPKDVHTLDVALPRGTQAIGWGGLTQSGIAEWVGWDLDVGHGAKSYPSTAAAIEAAHQIRATLEGHAEIRLSRSGTGVHVRHWCKPAKLTNADAIKLVKALARRLNIEADPSPLGRQCFYAWDSNPGEDGFLLIAEDRGLETHLATEGGYSYEFAA